MPKGAPFLLVLALVLGAFILVQSLHPGGSSLFRMAAQPPAVQSEGIAVYFSPHGGCEAAVVDQIDSAKQTIDMQCYSFTSRNISQALAEAQSRGVKVRVIFDKNASDEPGSQAQILQESNIEVYSDGQHAIAHNKVIIVDQQTVLTGSFNFTNQAENSNAENLIVLSRKPDIAAAYERNFAEHLGHSETYTPGSAEKSERNRFEN